MINSTLFQQGLLSALNNADWFFETIPDFTSDGISTPDFVSQTFINKFVDEGRQMWMYSTGGASNHAIRRYDLTTPYDITTMTFTGISPRIEADWFDIDPNGINLIGNTQNHFYTYVLPAPFDVLSSSPYLDYTTNTYNIRDFRILENGTKLIGMNPTVLYEYNIPTPYILDTMTLTNTYVLDATGDTQPGYRFVINAAGTQILSCSNNGYFALYDMSVPRDTTTLTLRQAQIKKLVISTSGLSINPTGTKIYTGSSLIDVTQHST